MSLWNLVYILHLQYASIRTSHTVGPQQPHVARGYCIGQQSFIPLLRRVGEPAAMA